MYGFDFDYILNSPCFDEIFLNSKQLAEEIKKYVTEDYYKNYISTNEINKFETDLQTDLQTDFTDITFDYDKKIFNLIFLNLNNMWGNSKIVMNVNQFKASFITAFIEKLPYYHAYFSGYNLSPTQSKEGFNNQGKSTYKGSQNTGNNINNINNFDTFMLSAYTPEEQEKQMRFSSTKISEFIYSFSYFFNGVRNES